MCNAAYRRGKARARAARAGKQSRICAQQRSNSGAGSHNMPYHPPPLLNNRYSEFSEVS